MQIVMPTSGPKDWKQFLAKASHWKEGHSAMALAQCWESSKQRGMPPEVQRILPEAQALIGIPELKVNLPPRGGRPSQTDLFVLAREPECLVAITVEGKVEESFGPTLEERLQDRSSGVKQRIAFLLTTLRLPESVPGSIRYQLLHRTVAAILSANAYSVRRAVMLVHSFSTSGTWYDDFAAFAQLFGIEAKKDVLLPAGEFGGVDLSLAWCSVPRKFLKRLTS